MNGRKKKKKLCEKIRKNIEKTKAVKKKNVKKKINNQGNICYNTIRTVSCSCCVYIYV